MQDTNFKVLTGFTNRKPEINIFSKKISESFPKQATENWSSSALRTDESLNFASTSFPQNSFSPTLCSGENVKNPQNIETCEGNSFLLKRQTEEKNYSINVPNLKNSSNYCDEEDQFAVACEGKCNLENLTFSPERSVGENEFCGNEVEAKLSSSILLSEESLKNVNKQNQNKNDIILSELNALRDEYYNDNGKNLIFKKKQKAEIAKKICNNFDLLFLFKKTIFRIKNTNIVFIDYKFFKIYMNEIIYNDFINYVLYLFDETIKEHNSLVVQLDADTITPSAVERYKPIIVKFNERCVHTNYISYLQKWVIYNVPSFIDSFVNILTIIIHPDILHSLEKYSKEESRGFLEKLKMFEEM